MDVTLNRQGAAYTCATLGTVSARIPAGICTDEWGRFNEASTSTDNVVTYQPDAPGYVICVKPGGNDAYDGSSWEWAVATVQKALDLAGPLVALPDIIPQVWVAAGTYNVPVKSGSFVLPPDIRLFGGFAGIETTADQRDCRANVTTLVGNGSGPVVLAANGSTTGASSNYNRWYNQHISGFTITNGICGVCVSRTEDEIWTYAAVSDNIITGNGSGVSTGQGCTARIYDNVIAGNSARGVACSILEEGIGPNAIFNNVITGSSIGICSGYTYSLVANNTIVGNGVGHATSEGDGNIGNNIVAYNGVGISSGGGQTIVDHSCLWGNGTDFQGSFGECLGNIFTDPMFVSRTSENYRLVHNSPCVDNGNRAWSDAVFSAYTRDFFVDCDGYWRDTYWASETPEHTLDMGAYEVQPVIIKRAAGQSDQTSVLPINFTVVFSRPVTGFQTGDVTLTLNGASISPTQTITNSGDSKTFNVAVSSGIPHRGVLCATLATGVCTDMNGVANPAQSTPGTVNYRP